MHITFGFALSLPSSFIISGNKSFSCKISREIYPKVVPEKQETMRGIMIKRLGQLKSQVEMKQRMKQRIRQSKSIFNRNIGVQTPLILDGPFPMQLIFNESGFQFVPAAGEAVLHRVYIVPVQFWLHNKSVPIQLQVNTVLVEFCRMP